MPYHHGDLKAALTDAAVDLIAERGVHGFSLAELARRTGVTAGAPYRHFASREELLAQVALRALRSFRMALVAEVVRTDPPERRLAAMAGGYVRFAAGERALFSVVFGLGLDKKSRYPELRQAWEEVEELISACVDEVCPADPEGAERLADAVEATAHGFAALLTDEPGEPDPADVDRAAHRAATATLALVQGRTALSDET